MHWIQRSGKFHALKLAECGLLKLTPQAVHGQIALKLPDAKSLRVQILLAQLIKPM